MSPTLLRNSHVAVLSVLLAVAACRDSSSPQKPPSAIAADGSPVHIQGTAGTPVSPAPAVRVTDANGQPLAGIEVRFDVVTGGGSVAKGVTRTGNDGRASVGAWTLGTTAGTNTLSATVNGLEAVVFTATAAPGAATGLAFTVQPAGVVEGIPIAQAIVVELRDQFGNRATTSNAFVSLSLAVGPSGAGLSGTTGTATTAGIATFSNVSVSAPSLPTPVIASVTPSVITSSAATRIQGQAFGSLTSQNTVFVNGQPAAIVSGNATELNIVAPQFPLDCLPTRNTQIVVHVDVPAFVIQLQASSSGLNSALSAQVTARKGTSTTHPIRSTPLLSLGVGQSTIFTTPAAARCIELPQNGGRYFISVFTANSTSVSSVQYSLRGLLSGVAASPPIAAAASPGSPAQAAPSATNPLFGAQRTPAQLAVLERAEAAHVRMLQENERILRNNPHPMFSVAARAALVARSAVTPAPPAAAPAAVGTLGSINEFRYSFTSCGDGFTTLNGRTAWVGQHAIIVEDMEPFGPAQDPLNGTLDDRYAAIGQEFDTKSWPIIVQNFGNPLAVDAQMPQPHGKVIMLFTPKVVVSGAQAFVFSCDFFPRSVFSKSNEAPIFYARPATVSQAGFSPSAPDGWQWVTRSTVIHETKHISSYAERISRSAFAGFEQAWLEEGGARIAEELFGRTFYGSAWKDNSTFQTFRCDLHPTEAACAGRPFVMPKHFGATISPPALYDFLDRSETHSVLCIDPPCTDVSFYGSAWSMIRWSVDNFAINEQSALSLFTQTSTLSGALNVQSLTQLSWPEIMGQWSLMLATDDLPGFVPQDPRLKLPSWNLRAVFSGLNSEFGAAFPKVYPLTPRSISFSDFVSPVTLLMDGGFSMWELSGVQSASHVIALEGPFGAAPPQSLRMAVVRVQ